MNYETAKKASDVVLDGCTVEFHVRDGQLAAVTIKDANGHELRVEKTDYSSISALVPAKPKMVKRWRVVGTALGLKVEELFENEWDATARRNALDEGVRDDHEFKVEQVEVPE